MRPALPVPWLSAVWRSVIHLHSTPFDWLAGLRCSGAAARRPACVPCPLPVSLLCLEYPFIRTVCICIAASSVRRIMQELKQHRKWQWQFDSSLPGWMQPLERNLIGYRHGVVAYVQGEHATIGSLSQTQGAANCCEPLCNRWCLVAGLRREGAVCS